ncbi:hypothetical protein D5b_00129 [Faustovirus]|nr:hypothetical protein D5b_00129 [Faustovirus]AMN84782.1 hypothetical protein D6_00382 [Faustovirus]AMP44086.1 hypothetical protein PRJ_Dakar_00127 [Faustovirus]
MYSALKQTFKCATILSFAAASVVSISTIATTSWRLLTLNTHDIGYQSASQTLKSLQFTVNCGGTSALIFLACGAITNYIYGKFKASNSVNNE